MQIKNTAKVNRRLLADVKGVCGSLYSLNAPNSTGYGFHEAKDNNSIGRGMFLLEGVCYLNFKTGELTRNDQALHRIWW